MLKVNALSTKGETRYLFGNSLSIRTVQAMSAFTRFRQCRHYCLPSFMDVQLENWGSVERITSVSFNAQIQVRHVRAEEL